MVQNASIKLNITALERRGLSMAVYFAQLFFIDLTFSFRNRVSLVVFLKIIDSKCETFHGILSTGSWRIKSTKDL